MRGLAKTERDHGAMGIVDVDRPSVGAHEALVEVDFAGLCGSDAGIYEFEPAFERMDLPTVVGHEYTGRVVDTGEHVTSVEVGQRVVERPIRGCGDCYQCRAGQENVCQRATITGVDRDGAYRGAIAVPARALNVVSEDVDPRHAALVEPTSIGTRAVVRNSRVRAGRTALVEGPGPIGLLTAQVARAQGADVVVSGVGRDAAYRLPLARELGFETLNLAEDNPAERRAAATDGVGYDVVFDTTGHPSGLETAVEQVRQGGQVVLVGMTGETTMDYAPVVRGEIDVQASYASTWDDFETAIDLIRSGDVDLKTLLDDRFSLEDADAAFEAFLAGETCKPLFDVSVMRD